jgi:hypothetical protein
MPGFEVAFKQRVAGLNNFQACLIGSIGQKQLNSQVGSGAKIRDLHPGDPLVASFEKGHHQEAANGLPHDQ